MNISKIHVVTVCLLGQGATTCRYLSRGLDGWKCEKLNPAMRVYLDTRVDMIARGDNCPGWGVASSDAAIAAEEAP